MARTGATSCRVVSIHRQRELKRCAEGYVWSDPQPATVGFDDRTADWESHTHAAGFCGEEGLEQSLCILGGDPDAAIRHTYVHLLFLFLSGLDHQLALAIRDR